MAKYYHLFFDLDRTLWDFETSSAATIKELYNKHNLQLKGIHSFDMFISTYHKINDRLWEYYRKGYIDKGTLRGKRFYSTLLEFGVDDFYLAEVMGEQYIKQSPYQTYVLPYTHDVLHELKNKFKLHIITNGFEDIQHIKIENSGLKKYFTHIITSERANATKPDKKIFDYSLKLAKARREESLTIGDNLELDILGAKNAGIDQVYFNPSKVVHNEEVTHEIDSLIQLLDILK